MYPHTEEENAEKLEAFHAAVNSNGNSHLVTVPPGTILSDMLFGTPIFMEEGAAGGAGDAAEGGGAARRRKWPGLFPLFSLEAGIGLFYRMPKGF